ncbi:MAG TPA: PLP-dependent aminotransferase family protein, partial [Candidatus Binatia bacterium]|nr:PLP-dependent aminotransferase family protein [Candidatus Binatia bacterium]
MPDLRTTQLDLDSNIIDLGIGQPGFDLLPLDLIRDAAERRLSQGDRAFLNYGYEQGDGRFRQLLAQFLQRHTASEVLPENLMITCGASQGLDMICTHFARSGDTIFVEEPSYFLALRIFADRGLNVVGVPTDAQGLRLDALQELLARQQPAFLYTVPTFQNPSGVTLPAVRRSELLRLAQEHNFFVVADEVYQLLDYSASPPPPMAHFGGEERLLSLGSFS